MHLILEFISFLKKQEIYKNIKKLKGTGVAIANDASYEDRTKQRILVHHLKEAKIQNLSARIKGFSLEIEDKLYTVEDLKELEESLVSSSDSEEGDIETKVHSRCQRGSTSSSVNAIISSHSAEKKELSKKVSQKSKKYNAHYSPKTRSSKQIKK
ncbi:unnamed protein product [Psylliodes chrysocephalus]|uniref:Uncharacterized protein n=1 Tax=Psylliodes chrysocephalus TaxID=3402493 RepID=A0A9P0D2F3_9CUCU|nr:unnamed protein product [Psylliodes chrysocephala]